MYLAEMKECGIGDHFSLAPYNLKNSITDLILS